MRGVLVKLLAGILLAAGAFVTFLTFNTPAEASDCSSNAILKCGGYNYNTIKDKYNRELDSPGAKTMYAHFGITSAMVNGGAQVHEGYITRTNKAYMGNKVVATDVKTMGRHYLSGSQSHNVNGTKFYVRSPSVSFRASSLQAYILTDQYGKFLGAIIKDCGNPITGTPVYEPKKLNVCDLTTGNTAVITQEQYDKATSKYSKNPADCTNESACDIHSKDLVTVDRFKIDNKRYTKDLEKCKVERCAISTQERVRVFKKDITNDMTTDMSKCVKEYIVVCDLTTGETKKINKRNYNNKKHADKAQCADTPVCDTATKRIKTVKKYQVKSPYTTDLTKCQVKVCNINTGKIETKRDDSPLAAIYTKNLAMCSDMEVCIPSTGEVKTIKKSQYDSGSMTEDLEKCKEVKMLTVCDKTTNGVVKIKEADYDATKHSKDATDCEKVTVCNTATKTVVKDLPRHKLTNTMTSDMSKCKITVCDLATDTIISIFAADYDADKHNKTNPEAACDKIEVCDKTAKKVVTIRKSELDQSKHSTTLEDCKAPCAIEGKGDLKADDPNCKEDMCTVDGKGDLKANDPNCKEDEKCAVEGKEHLMANSPNCKEDVTPTPEEPKTPEQPVIELPKTGVASVLSSTLGLGAMVIAGYYYIASRRV